MDLGLGTLTELKAHLLNAALVSGTDYDGAIAALGRGVAGRFDQYCNRHLARAVDATFETSANRTQIILDRYPVETISKIEIRDSLTLGWIDQGDVNNVLFNLRAAAGLAEFAGYLGGNFSRIRFTFTGGFWIDLSGDSAAPDVSTWKQNSVALSVNDESKAVVFAIPFLAAPNVRVSIVPPSGGQIISVVPSAITAAGFTAIIGFPIPATGYVLQWDASATSTGAMPATSLPDGATPLPDALKLAWLLQCEATWQLRDKLGLAIGQPPDSRKQLNLSSLQLVPEVEQILKDHIRYAIT